MVILGADLGLFLTYLAACMAAATTGAMFDPGAWYKRLDKPWWTPPALVFPIAWTVLYLCMAYAAARIGARDGALAAQASAFWAVQIALNTLWTPVFFGLHRIRAGMVVMVFLWLAVAATTVSFGLVDPVAGWVMLPYLAWVTIAGALNLSVMRRNPALA
ncbi:MAG: tryptophan-rich sensory protein TspO [Gemmobacter sp.]